MLGTVIHAPGGVGADSMLECVGTQDSVTQALRSARPGGMVGWVGVPHVAELPQQHMFWRNVGLRGGPAPVRAYLPDLLDRVLDGRIEPGLVCDLTLPLSEVAEGYAAMDAPDDEVTLERASRGAGTAVARADGGIRERGGQTCAASSAKTFLATPTADMARGQPA